MEAVFSFFTTQSRRTLLLSTFILLSVVLFALRWRRADRRSLAREGFSQTLPFSAKYGADCYDDFYAEIYDDVHRPNQHLADVRTAIESTMPTADSVFLDVGCGTGEVAHMIDELGFSVYGADKSSEMVHRCVEKYPKMADKIKVLDCTEPMAYDKGTITHILCTDKTIYQFSDKVAFFRNCFLWLRPGGYLFVHMVDKDKFDPISPAGRPSLISAPQDYAKERITATDIDFGEFRYRAAYDFAGRGGNVVLSETFVDTESRCVRQNEQTLYMEDVDTVLGFARYAGFLPKGQMSMKAGLGDANQFIFILERPM